MPGTDRPAAVAPEPDPAGPVRRDDDFAERGLAETNFVAADRDGADLPAPVPPDTVPALPRPVAGRAASRAPTRLAARVAIRAGARVAGFAAVLVAALEPGFDVAGAPVLAGGLAEIRAVGRAVGFVLPGDARPLVDAAARAGRTPDFAAGLPPGLAADDFTVADFAEPGLEVRDPPGPDFFDFDFDAPSLLAPDLAAPGLPEPDFGAARAGPAACLGRPAGRPAARRAPGRVAIG